MNRSARSRHSRGSSSSARDEGNSGRSGGNRRSRRGRGHQQQQQEPYNGGGGRFGGGRRNSNPSSFGGGGGSRHGGSNQRRERESRPPLHPRVLNPPAAGGGLMSKDPILSPCSVGGKADAISVAVRFRPLSKKEKSRGDTAVWEVDDSGTVGLSVRGCFKPKYKYDHVFSGESGNQEVYQAIAENVVKTAMNGINGTVFAYGVTSSGKTHTIMGSSVEPGIVPQAIAQVFEMIENMPSKEFLLRLSMMEIYNEVLNDLLESSHTNLKIRQCGSKGIHVDGLKEEVIMNQEHALSLVAAGEANRKVSSTAFNEDSSRSHTLCRLSIEVSERREQGDQEGGDQQTVSRTLSYLNLIDLAGSESAKAVRTKGHRLEGSYINKSLLTLGTVIHKLSEGRAAHVPFRDSKLTRLLQASLTGTGAKVAIICTVTPASAQAEETHNTLKFATRAKKIEVKASRNEIMDEKSLIRRYQLEIADLRKRLEHLAARREASPVEATVASIDKDIQQELCDLRERLEEELRARIQREEDKAKLEARIGRLTRLILHSTRTLESAIVCRGQKPLQRSRSFDHARMEHITNLARQQDPPSDLESSGTVLRQRSLSTEYSSRCSTPVEISPLRSEAAKLGPVWDVRSDTQYVLMESAAVGKLQEENQRLREDIELMALEMDAKEKDVEGLKSRLKASLQTTNTLHTASSVTTDGALEMTVLQADREVLQDALSGVRSENKRLLDDNVKLKVELKKVKKERDYARQQNDDRLTPHGMHQMPFRSDRHGQSQTVFMLPGIDQDSTPTSPTGSSSAAEGVIDIDHHAHCKHPVSEAGGLVGRWSSGLENGCDTDIRGHLLQMEHQVQNALDELLKKDQQLSQQKDELAEIQRRERRIESKLLSLVEESDLLKKEHARLQEHNQRLQGYLLDGMSGDDLNKLIYNLTSAAKRVKLSVQLRKLQTATSPGSTHDTNKQSSEQS